MHVHVSMTSGIEKRRTCSQIVVYGNDFFESENFLYTVFYKGSKGSPAIRLANNSTNTIPRNGGLEAKTN